MMIRPFANGEHGLLATVLIGMLYWESREACRHPEGAALPAGQPKADRSSRPYHHGITPNVAWVKLPVGPSGPSIATRTASAAPSSTVSVPPGLILVFV